MKSLENLLEDFLSKNEWNINKLKGTDVIHYLQEITKPTIPSTTPLRYSVDSS